MKTMSFSFTAKWFLALFILFGVACSSSAKQKTHMAGNYPLILQFYSIGTGVPGDEPLKTFITTYRKKNKLPELSATVVGGLGREGEYAILFPLKELNEKQRKQFLATLSKALPDLKKKEENGGINLSEDQPFDVNSGRGTPQQVQF